MRVQHTPHAFASYPVYSAAFLSPDELLLGGGGGQTRSGVKNKLKLYHVESHKKIELLDELELAKDDDVPMSMAARVSANQFVAGVNIAPSEIEKGHNENCRLFEVQDKKIKPVRTKGTLVDPKDTSDYQKVTVISPDGQFIAVAGEHNLALLTYPELTRAANPITIDRADIYDATFSTSQLVIATTVSLLVYALPSADEKGKAASAGDLALLYTLDRPTLPGTDAGSQFRAARFHPSDPHTLYTLSNTVPPRPPRGRGKGAARPTFVCKWDAKTWKVKATRKVGDKAATCFDVSANGKLLAYGLSDYTVGVLDAQTLAPLVTVLKAHELPPTTLKFNPPATLLVSGSADNTIRLIDLPENIGVSSWGATLLSIFVALIVALLAIAANMMYGPGFESFKW